MKLKVLTIFFIALLAKNLGAESPAFKVDSIKPIIVDVLNKVVNISTTFLNEANSAIKIIETDPIRIRHGLIDMGKRNGKHINLMILLRIDQLLRDSSTEDGKAVIDCIKAERGKTDNYITNVFTDIGTCADGKTSKVLAEVKVILARLTDLKNDVQVQTDTLSSCSKDELKCLLDFATTILDTLRRTFSSDKKEVLEAMSNIYGDVTDCVRDVGKKVKSDVQEEFNEIIVCIKKK